MLIQQTYFLVIDIIHISIVLKLQVISVFFTVCVTEQQIRTILK